MHKYQEYQHYLDFIDNAATALNPATASKVDANANIETQSMPVIANEIYKTEAIKINRLAMQQKIEELYGNELAEQYIKDLENHFIYRHDETGLVGTPYCASITLYPFLLDGLRSMGGTSGPPHNLQSFTGGFINLVFAVAAQLLGACLHKDQKLLIKEVETENIFFIPVKEFHSRFKFDKSFKNGNEEWEYSTEPYGRFMVWEDERWVDIKKAYRRKYKDDIYKITTNTGLTAKVSKDHKFKTLRNGKVEQTRAEDLIKNETVFVSKDYSLALKKKNNENHHATVDPTREIYYYSNTAFEKAGNTPIMPLSCGNRPANEKLKLDVITKIEKEKNDDEYVYEIETDSHWYNCGGMITHNCLTPEWLSYMDYFLRKDYGNDWHLNLKKIVDLSVRERTIKDVIYDTFQQVVYSLNQPAA